MATTPFLLLTHTSGRAMRVNMALVRSYWWVEASNTYPAGPMPAHTLLVYGSGDEDYDRAKETPDQIDAMLGLTRRIRKAAAKQTKRDLLVAMVSRPEGASLEEMLDAVGWKECRGTLGKQCRKLGLALTRKDGRYYASKPEA